jgi:hypothetical protein
MSRLLSFPKSTESKLPSRSTACPCCELKVNRAPVTVPLFTPTSSFAFPSNFQYEI